MTQALKKELSAMREAQLFTHTQDAIYPIEEIQRTQFYFDLYKCGYGLRELTKVLDTDDNKFKPGMWQTPRRLKDA